MKRNIRWLRGTMAILAGIGAISSLPVPSAWATTTSAPPSSGGWVQVSTAAQLEYIDQNQSSYLTSNIELMNDIELPVYTTWIPFGGNAYSSFSGTFNGQGHEIQGLAMNDATSEYIGFFGDSSGTIENLGVSVNFAGVAPSGSTGQWVGGLVGAQSSGSITNSYAIGTVSSGNYNAGGLVGAQNGNITSSYADVSVSAPNNNAGGLVGGQAGDITDSYAAGPVSGATSGGLVGNFSHGNISDCYAVGKVSATGSSPTGGGLIGIAPLIYSITGDYFDTNTTGQSQAVGSDNTGLNASPPAESTTAMQTSSTFTGWSTSTWTFLSGQYPLLQWQLAANRYTILYDGNGSTGGVIPTDNSTYLSGMNASVLDNTGGLTKTGYLFTGWNTAADGTGANYVAGSSLAMGTANVTLYAQWKSQNANLANLTLSNGTLSPGFTSSTTSYTANVSYTTTSIDVTPTLADSTATMTVNGAAATSGSAVTVALSVGANTIPVVVTAQDGTTTMTYTVTVTRAAVSTNANLSNITLSQGTLSPTFATGTTSYTVSVPYTTTSIDVTPTLADSTATMTVDGATATSGSAVPVSLSVGTNSIPVVVKAQDGTTTNTYTVSVTRAPASTSANLSNMTLSQGTLSPMFASGTMSYTASVGDSVSSLTVTPTTADSTETVTVNGSPVTSGQASGSIALAQGTTTAITVVVTAQDGTTTKTYTIDVTRVLSAPTGPATSSTTSTGTTLTWGAVTGATSYNVYEKGLSTPIATGLTGTSYTLNGLTPGTSYTYTVTAVNASGKSAPSAEVTVNTASIGTVDLNFGSTDVLSGASQTVTGVVYDVNGTPVPNVIVNLSSTIGSWGESSVTADVYGAFSTTWTAPILNAETSGTVTATVYGTVYGPVTANVTPTTLSFEVSTLPSVSTTSLSGATTGSQYSQILSVTGGFAPYTWSVTSGLLPAGLTLNASTGEISGTPTTTGTSTFTIQVQDAGNNTATKNLSIVVRAPASTNANLSNITLSQGTLSPTFATGTTNYTSSVPHTTSSIDVTPTLTDSMATMTVNGTPATSGSKVTIPLSVGPNPIPVVVTAQDGTTTTTYTVTVTRAPAPVTTGGSSSSSGGSTSSGGNSSTGSGIQVSVNGSSQSVSTDGGQASKTTGATTVDVTVPKGAMPGGDGIVIDVVDPKTILPTVPVQQPANTPTTNSTMVVGVKVSFTGATPTVPITLTIHNPNVQAGGVLYKVLPDGTLVPMNATVSNGQIVVTFSTDPNFVFVNAPKAIGLTSYERAIVLNGQVSVVPNRVYQNTTYIPIWYVMQMMNKLNMKSTWNGTDWHLTTNAPINMSNVSPGNGTMHMYLNGTLVQSSDKQTWNDPFSGKKTTYVPIWYLMQLLKRNHVASTWDGKEWVLIPSSNA